MSERNVQFAIFPYTGQVHCAVKNAIVAAGNEIAKRGWGSAIMEIIGDAMIPHARNTAHTLFLESGATDLVMCDDDNYCSSADFLRLIDHDVDVVAAPCRSRVDPLKWPVRWMHDAPMQRAPNGLMEVQSVGTGIIRFTRSCIEQMVEAYSHRWFVNPNVKTGKSVALFEYEIENNNWWGEDVTFCRRWRKLGGKVWIDPDIVTAHIGTVEFTNSVANWLGAQPRRINLVSEESNEQSWIENRLSATPAEMPQAEAAE